ncbi:hypothetical protein ABQF26_04630 [Mycolicibacterium elephantis]
MATGQDQPAKVCTKCRQLVPLERFHRDSRVPDGRTSHCKRCVRAHKAARPDVTRAAKARYRNRQRKAAQHLARVLDAPCWKARPAWATPT